MSPLRLLHARHAEPTSHNASRIADESRRGRALQTRRGAAVLAIALSLLAPAGASAATGWSAAGTLSVCCGTLTTLPGNLVVSISGSNRADGQTRNVSVYRPASNSWTTAAAIPVGREGHTATLLTNGRVLVTGGGTTTSGEPVARTELYDPTADAWSQPAPLLAPRINHTATALPDGRILVAGGGGINGEVPIVQAGGELYNPSADTWTASAPMGSARELQSAVALPGGKVLVAGGRDASAVLASAELYDPSANTWSPAGAMSIPRQGSFLTVLADGRLLAAGGAVPGTRDTAAQVDLYNPATNTWSPVASMTTPRYFQASAALLADGRVLVHGGIDDADERVHIDNEIYDPAVSRWAAAGANTPGRIGGQLVALTDGRLLLAGLIGPVRFPFEAEIYDPRADTTAGERSALDSTVPSAFDGAAPGDTTPPTIVITEPASGKHFALGSTAPSAFSCTDATGWPAATCVGPQAVDTSTPGTKTFVVTATDKAGNPATQSVSYIVDPLPPPPPCLFPCRLFPSADLVRLAAKKLGLPVSVDPRFFLGGEAVVITPKKGRGKQVTIPSVVPSSYRFGAVGCRTKTCTVTVAARELASPTRTLRAAGLYRRTFKLTAGQVLRLSIPLTKAQRTALRDGDSVILRLRISAVTQAGKSFSPSRVLVLRKK